MTFSCIGTARLRLGVDGEGVTTLICGSGCPLDCKYCLNPQCHKSGYGKVYTLDELWRETAVDSLYFEATGGGVTFGGGEPLLQSDFISAFIDRTKSEGRQWHFSLETSLAVDEALLDPVRGKIDLWIVDVKDLNPSIYRAYTGRPFDKMLKNLARLAQDCPEKVLCRVPLIPGFNEKADMEATTRKLAALGLKASPFVYRTKIDKPAAPAERPADLRTVGKPAPTE